MSDQQELVAEPQSEVKPTAKLKKAAKAAAETPGEIQTEEPLLENEIKLPQNLPKAVAAEKATATPLLIDRKRNTLIARDNTELMRIVQILMQGQAFPKGFDTPAKCITAWNLACTLLPEAPQRAIAYMMYVNGMLGIWGELPMYLAERTKEITDKSIFLVDQDYNKICLANKNFNAEPMAGVFTIKRGQRTAGEYIFTMDDAQKAGLLGKSGPWQQYRKIMLMRRAQATGLKLEFADALMGADIIEGRHNALPEKEIFPPDNLQTVNNFNNFALENSAPKEIAQ